MSNKVYLVQKSPIVGRLNYSTRQTVIPHVITHAPVVRVIQNTPPQTEDLNETDILDFDRPQQKTRRRERLNHLTPEQKMDRRKMKNREAAQNARDRKKMQGQQMEQKLKIMAAEIRQLRTENAKLRAQLNNQQTQQYIPSEYDSMSTKALTESSSSPRSDIVESAVFSVKKSLPWIIREATNFLFNRQRTPVSASKYTRRPRLTIKPMKCRSTNQSLLRKPNNGIAPSLLQILMFLAHNSNHRLPSSRIKTKPANTTNSCKVNSSTRSHVNCHYGMKIRALPRKSQMKERLLCRKKFRSKK